MGTAWHEIHESPSDFQGSAGAHRTPQEPRCFTGTPFPYLRANRFQGLGPLQRKENSSRGPRRRLRLRLRYRTRPSRANLRVQVREYWPDSLSMEYGQRRFLFWFLFFHFSFEALPPFQNGALLSLRADWPMFNCCSHGTLLHFSLQSSRLNICYYHQDLHPWRLHPGSRPKASVLTTATLLLVRAWYRGRSYCADGPV